jgi:hypothetical protein
MQACLSKGGFCNESSVSEKTGPGLQENSFMFFGKAFILLLISLPK